MEQARTKPSGDLLDRLAIGLSGLCLVHCVATVVVVSLLASAGGLLLHPLIHEIGLAFAILLAGFGLGRGYLAHRRVLPAAIGSVGLAGMAAGLMVPHGVQELVLTVAGVSLVALAHTLNRRAH